MLWVVIAILGVLGILCVAVPERVRRALLRVTPFWQSWPRTTYENPDAADLIRWEGLALLGFLCFVIFIIVTT